MTLAAPQVTAARETPAAALILAVSEGTSGGIDAAEAEQKYAGIVALIAKGLGQPLKFEFVRDFASLEQGMKAARFDFVIARPSDYPARGIRDYGYHFVASAEPAGHCQLIVPKQSMLKDVRELKGQYLILPERASYMTKFCLAELRDAGIPVDERRIHFVAEQDAIPFGLEHGMAAAGGVASYSRVYRRWLASGHRVLYSSRAQPYLPVIAAGRLDEARVVRVRQLLTGLGASSEGRAELGRLGVTGFIASEEGSLRQLLTWLSGGNSHPGEP